jgi:hypothetical protein
MKELLELAHRSMKTAKSDMRKDSLKTLIENAIAATRSSAVQRCTKSAG